jgi:recombinational DNA repair protein (RecF pathway)
MLEHYTTAIVLGIEPRGEIDAAVTLYTKDFGKLTAKAKSFRKITSKLAGHLMPGNLVQVRLIEHGDGKALQVLDVLSEKPKGNLVDLLHFLNFLAKTTPVALPDLRLWHEAEQAVREGDFTPKRYRRMLAELGLASGELSCDDCASKNVAYFVPGEVIFLCANSMRKLNIAEDDAVKI